MVEMKITPMTHDGIAMAIIALPSNVAGEPPGIPSPVHGVDNHDG